MRYQPRERVTDSIGNALRNLKDAETPDPLTPPPRGTRGSVRRGCPSARSVRQPGRKLHWTVGDRKIDVMPRRYAEWRQLALHDRTSRKIAKALGRYEHGDLAVVPYDFGQRRRADTHPPAVGRGSRPPESPSSDAPIPDGNGEVQTPS